MVADLTDELDQRIVQQVLDLVVEIGPVGGVDLRGDLQLLAQALGDGDGAVRPLLGRDAAQERQIAVRRFVELVDLGGHAVQHRARPVGEGQGLALVVRDRDQRILRPAAIDARQVLQVQAAVQGGQGLFRHVLEHRELDHVGVEMDDVEAMRLAANLVQHGHVGGQVRLQRRGVQADGLVAHDDQLGLGASVARGEQGDLVPKIDQGVGQMRHDAFCTAIEAWRNGFVQGRHLGDLHR